MAFLLLCLCASFCKHVHPSRTTPPSICSVLKLFDEDVQSCLTSSLPVDIPDSNWSQAKLSPNMGGLGLHSLSGHSPAAFISSLATSRFGSPNNIDLQQDVAHFNSHVSQHDTVAVKNVLASPPHQYSLSKKLDSFNFQLLISSFSPVNKA